MPDKRIEQAETVLIVGPTPPPAHGISVLTELLLKIRPQRVLRDCSISILRTGGRSTTSGRFEFRNVVLALYHGARLSMASAVEATSAGLYAGLREPTGFCAGLPSSFCRADCNESLSYFISTEVISTLSMRSGGAVFQWLMRFCFGHAARAIVLSDSFRGKFAGLVEEARIRVVGNGIPLTIYEACKNKPRSASDSSPKTVLFLGGLIESKGF